MKMKTELFRKIVQTWRATSLLLLATAPAFAQMEVCAGEGFMITSKADAQSISGGVTYTWHESTDGGGTYEVVKGQTAASLPVPDGQSEAGTYAYVRYAASDACPGGVPTKPYTVVVNPLPTISPFPPIHAVPGTTVTLTASGDYTYTWSTGSASQSITVTAPAVDNTDTYSCTATNVQGCSTSATASVIGTKFYAASTTTLATGGRIWSYNVEYPLQEGECESMTQEIIDESAATHSACGDIRRYPVTHYTWDCMMSIAGKLCPLPWRLPTSSELGSLSVSERRTITTRSCWWNPGWAATENKGNWSTTEASDSTAFVRQSSTSANYVNVKLKRSRVPVVCVRP